MGQEIIKIQQLYSIINLMTFFGQERKNLINVLKPTQKVGPGSYSSQKQLAQKRSYAPFGSLLRKCSAVKNRPKQVVGPGSYNIRGDILKPNVVQYQNQNCIIIKINEQGGSQFKSRQQRFNTQVAVDTPGPGSYINTDSSGKLERSRRTKSVGQSFNKMKQLYSINYINKRKPTLVSDKPEVPEQQQRPKTVVKGVLRWDLNKKQRFHSEQKQYFNQEDKSIILDKASMQRKKLKQGPKQSSFFASKSIKSCFDQMIFKSSNPLKVQIRKKLGFQDQSPGPGSYNLNNSKQVKKPLNFQFFGSTVDRFSNQNQSIGVGPGDYEVNPQKNEQRLKNKKILKANRKTLTQPDEQEQSQLGPGCYNFQQSNQKTSFNMKCNHGVADFGSRQPRFPEQKNQQNQQKSEYISFMAQQDQQRKKRIQQQFNIRRNSLKNKNNSVFASQLKRNCFPEAQVAKDKPFGIYQVGVEDISTRLRKKKQLIQQFQQCNLSKPGFMSAVDRFKEQKFEQSGHKDCWCQIKQVQKKNIQHMSPVFQSNCLRTEVFESKNKGPAVGQYSKATSFVKDSFNSRFIKQNKNKSKKIKIWKAKQ